ncbi:MAG: hypothetical protein U9R60_07175 [Bacteroidota bacterium]|nr:hypothetical protein [Bacteroidota bacterium]
MKNMHNLHFYGERGIVNGLVLDIKDDLELGKAVINSILWCGHLNTDWISNIQDIKYFVEPGFSKFGQPDLIMICTLPDGTKHYLIIEAKATPYAGSAMSNAKGMTPKNGYNSSINGQLSLDYRLALALNDHKREGIIQELESVLKGYQKALGEYNPGPRNAGKFELIKWIVKPYFLGLQLNNTYFIAMTRDMGKNPLNNVDDDFKPKVLDSDGNDCWDKYCHQFGFLSLQELDLMVLNLDGYFRDGCLVHIGEWEKVIDPKKFKGKRLVLINFKKFDKDWINSVNAVAECIKIGTPNSVKTIKNKGSYSFKIKGKTIGKLCPQNPKEPYLWVGFSIMAPNFMGYSKMLGQPQRFDLGPKKEPFMFVRAEELDKVCDVMIEFLKSYES